LSGVSSRTKAATELKLDLAASTGARLPRAIAFICVRKERRF
jgi:hypothetical protein